MNQEKDDSVSSPVFGAWGVSIGGESCGLMMRRMNVRTRHQAEHDLFERPW